MSISIYRTSPYFELVEMPYVDLDISHLLSTRAPLLKSAIFFLFQGFDNRARQGLDLGTPQGALQKRYIVYYNFLFKKFFLKNF